MDVFNFKMYCLFICKGDLNEKTQLLFDIVTASNASKERPKQIEHGIDYENIFKNQSQLEAIESSNQRLKNAIYLLVYFSEILPKVYLHN